MNKFVLIFGMPRSGTTWVGKIFDSHPEVMYLHEPDSVLRINDFPIFSTVDTEKTILQSYMSRMLSIKNTKVYNTQVFEK